MDKKIDLIILYGKISFTKNGKQQRMIDGGTTCGYRAYAEKYGCIIYLCPQKIRLPWEYSIPDTKKVVSFINKYPEAIVWSVKYDPIKDKNILSKISNKKLYYSCNSSHLYNPHTDISLVDTKDRIKKNAKIWFKGKDPDYWLPNSNKKYDYLLLGRRGDKNEVFFLNNLEAPEKRSILWVGGEAHKHKVGTKHKVTYTEFIGQDKVRKLIPQARVGILFTELKAEGFPQSFLELTMCGLPTVYNRKAPRNNFYFFPKQNCLLCDKKALILNAEVLLNSYTQEHATTCRRIATEHYSLDKSFQWMKSLCGK